MTQLAVLEITDGTPERTVSLLGGPFYLKEWAPGVSEYKDGGVYVDSPLSDGRRIVFKKFANVLERFIISQRSDGPDAAARDMQRLTKILERASDYWISGGRRGDPIYIKVRANNESSFRYADVISGRIPNTGNIFSMPFLQSDGATVQDELSVIIERSHWKGAPPGGASPVNLPSSVSKDNYLISGDFDEGPQSTRNWTELNSPTSVVYTKNLVYESPYSAKITGNSGADRGIYQDVGSSFLTSGSSYTITAWVYVQTGGAKLIAYDGGAVTNPVTDTATSSGWQQLSVTKTATASGIRVALTTHTTYYSVVYFSGAFLGRTFGQQLTKFYDPVFVSNYHSQTHLTHIFYNDVGTGYSSNLLDSTLPYAMFPASSAINDEVYFGSYISSDIGGPFSSILFNIGKTAGQVNTEILSNQSFESNLTGWQWGGFSINCVTVERTSAYGAKSGSYSVHLDYDVGCFMGATVPIDPFPNDPTSPWKKQPVPPTNSMLFEDSVNALPDGDNRFADCLQIGTGFHTISGTSVRFGGWFKWDRDMNPWSKVDWADNYPANYVLRIYWYDSSNNALGFDQKNVMVHTLVDGTVNWTYNEIVGQKPAGAVKCYAYVVCTVHVAASKAGIKGAGMLMDLMSLREPVAGYYSDWEYYNGSSWQSLTVRDDTDSFTVPGQNVVSWQIPDDWERTTINSVNAYWVKAVIGSLAGTFIPPEASTFHPHVVSKPYVDLPIDNIGGDLPALARLRLRNAGGPFDDTLAVRVSAGANDVYDDGATLTTGGSTAALSDGDSIGIRFENITIPQGAKIYFARLFVSPAGADSNGRTAFYAKIQCEDYDNATLWTNRTDYTNRTLTTEYYVEQLPQPYWGWSALDGEVQKFGNITNMIQEVIDRPGWASGNALHFRVTIDTHTAGDYRTFHMYESRSDAWQLELGFVQSETYTTTVVAGTRNKARGELFTAFINMRPKSQGGIEVQGAQFVGDAMPALPNRSAIAFGADDPTAPSFDRKGIVTIPRPLAEQYSGTFRVFLRVSHSSNLSGTYETQFRLVYYAGPSVTSSKIAQTGSVFPQIVDMGQITIPELSKLDKIRIDIFAARPDYNVGEAEQVYIHDLILMPSDEWTGEFTSRSPSVSGQLNADLILQIDSINPKKGQIEAALIDEATAIRKGAMSLSANKLSFDPKEDDDYRLWLLTITDTYLDYTNEVFLNDSTVERRAGLFGAVHSVQFYTLPTYLTLRGSL